MNFTPEEIAKLREIAAKATDRPWKCEHNWKMRRRDTGIGFVIGWAESPVVTGKHYSDIADKIMADRAYMQAAVNTHEATLTVIEQQRAEIGRLREALDSAAAAIASVVACCTYGSEEQAKRGAYGISHEAITKIDFFMRNHAGILNEGREMSDIPEEIRKMFPNQPIHKLDIDDNGDLHILASLEPLSNEPDFEHMPVEQINQYLRDHGFDPEQVRLNGKILVGALIENLDLRARAEAAERELAELKERTRWIPVSERLPLVVGGYDVVVSIMTPQGTSQFVAIRGFMGIEDGWSELSGTVTHWKERPFLPPEADHD